MKMRDEKGHFIKGHTGYKFWLGKKFPHSTRKEGTYYSK